MHVMNSLKKKQQKIFIRYTIISLILTIGATAPHLSKGPIFKLIPFVISLVISVTFATQFKLLTRSNVEIAKKNIKNESFIFGKLSFWERRLSSDLKELNKWTILLFLTILLPIILSLQSNKIIPVLFSSGLIKLSVGYIKIANLQKENSKQILELFKE